MSDPNVKVAILQKQLDIMVLEIEQLPGHPRYTDAQNFVKMARQALGEGQSDLHHREMRERFAKQDASDA